MKGWRGIVGAAALAASLVVPGAAQATYWEDAGWGALTMLSNVGYMPAKLVYATLGSLTGALALGLTAGDMDTAETVWLSSVGGTYVLTPGMLQGHDAIEFTAPTHGTATASTDGAPAIEEQPLGGS